MEFTAAWRLDEQSRGLSKLITGYDLLIRPAADGIAHDAARCQRIADRFLDADRVEVDRKGRAIDVRALVDAVAVVDGSEAASLCAALGWDDAPALLRVAVSMAGDGSAKPMEVARALGVWGKDDPRAPHARLARLGFRGVSEAHTAAEALAPIAAGVVHQVTAATSQEQGLCR
jgi:hypothetical protein